MATFEQRAMTFAQQAVVGLGLSLAAETGILQALADADSPMTSQQVAEAKGLKERYVRELLGSLSTAELVEVKEGEEGVFVYSLEKGAKQAVEGGVGPFVRFPAAIASRYAEIRDCLSADGPNGVRYSDGIQDMLDGFARTSIPGMITNFLDLVPGLKAKLEEGIDVIEFGAGMARLTATLAGQFPNSRFVASEYSEALTKTNKERWANVSNLSFSMDDLCAIPESPERQYDWVFCHDVIHDLPDPVEALNGIRRLLRKPDGVFTFVDIATSGSPVVDRGDLTAAMYYTAGTFLCIPESYQREDSLALGPCWGRKAAVKMAQGAGFDVKDVKVEDYSAMYICTHPKPE